MNQDEIAFYHLKTAVLLICLGCIWSARLYYRVYLERYVILMVHIDSLERHSLTSTLIELECWCCNWNIGTKGTCCI